jgi:hypothetical protein
LGIQSLIELLQLGREGADLRLERCDARREITLVHRWLRRCSHGTGILRRHSARIRVGEGLKRPNQRLKVGELLLDP